MDNLFLNQSYEDILSRCLQRVPDTFDKRRGSLIYTAIAPATYELALVYTDLQILLGKLNVDNLEGEELKSFVFQRTGIVAKEGTYATTNVVIEGTPGSQINAGDLVASEEINFVVQESKTIDPSGSATILVKSETLGEAGNVSKSSIIYFPIPLSGLSSVTNPQNVTNGVNPESDDSLRQRYYDQLQSPATSGNIYHYKKWAKEVAGVGDARVVSLWAGDNTVKVIIIDSSKQPASTELIAQVQEYIDPGSRGLGEGQAPIGAFCTVVSAVGKAIDITFTVVRDANYTVEQVKINVENNVTEYLKEIAFKDSIISYAKIGALVLDSDGVLDYEGLTINLGTSNIVIGNEEVAILGQVVINE